MTVLTCPFSEQDEDSSRHVILFLEIPVLILSSSLRVGLPNDLLSPSGFPTKTMYAFMLSSIRALCPMPRPPSPVPRTPCPMPHAPCPVPRQSQFSLICSLYTTECKWWSSSLCGFLQPLVTQSYVQISSSAPCLGSPSPSAETLNKREREIKCHTRIQEQAELCFCFLTSWQLLSYSNNTPRFKELQSSLPHSQDPATCLYPQPVSSSTILSSFVRPCLQIIWRNYKTETLYQLLNLYEMWALPRRGRKYLTWWDVIKHQEGSSFVGCDCSIMFGT